jgi:hypothetical protein
MRRREGTPPAAALETVIVAAFWSSGWLLRPLAHGPGCHGVEELRRLVDGAKEVVEDGLSRRCGQWPRRREEGGGWRRVWRPAELGSVLLR